MANKYWVGGAGTWDGSTTTRWSDSDGGAGGAVAPTASDDVIFNANSGLGSGGTVTVAATAVCNNFTISGINSKTVIFSFTGNPTFSGAMSWSGNSESTPLLFQSSVAGTARTITLNGSHGTHQYIHFQDITRAGTAGALTGTRIGDCGGNTGITFDASVERTCTMSTNQNWSTASIWTGTLIPLPQDDVVMTGVTGGTLTADQPRLGRSIDWTGATGDPTWNLNSVPTSFFGSITLIPGMTVVTGSGNNKINIVGRGNYTITSAGKTLAADIIMNAPTGTYTLNDAFTTTRDFAWSNGTFNLSTFNITTKVFTTYTGTKELVCNNNTWTVSSSDSGNVWSAGPGLSITGVLNVTISAASMSTRNFSGNSLTYGTLTYTVANSTGSLNVTGSNSFAAIVASDTGNIRDIKFTAATTTTIRNANGFPSGNATYKTRVDSITAANHTLTSTQQQSADYLDIAHSVVDVSPKWYAGINSTDKGTNTNWLFTAPPAIGGGGVDSPGIRNLQSLQNLMAL